jgi:Trp operon repressor
VEIKLLLKEGKLLQREIAKKYNVGLQNINAIKKGRIWK